MTLRDKALAAYERTEFKKSVVDKLLAVRAGIAFILGEEFRDVPIRRIHGNSWEYAFDIEGYHFLCKVEMSFPVGKTAYVSDFAVNPPSGALPKNFSDLGGLGRILSGD